MLGAISRAVVDVAAVYPGFLARPVVLPSADRDESDAGDDEPHAEHEEGAATLSIVEAGLAQRINLALSKRTWRMRWRVV